MPGRKSDSVWIYFDKIVVCGKTGCRARCKTCNKDMQGLVARMKSHYHSCTNSVENCIEIVPEPGPATSDLSDSAPTSPVPVPMKRAASTLNTPTTKKLKTSSINKFVMQTSNSEKAAIDLQVARFIYATNSPFSTVEHPEFKKFVQMLRPGYCPPSRFDVADSLLDKVQASLVTDCKEVLQDKSVCMALDGWSNIHNEPIVCVSVTTPDGDSFLTETVDTSGHPHTAEYMQEIATTAIKSVEQQFCCSVTSFVTDNAANMKKMRKQLEADSDCVVSYGCSAHYMNLLAKDVEIKGVKEHVVHVMKYFRNCHLPGAWYKAAGGKKLALPQEVRWNTVADCLQSYLDNWSVLLRVCEEHRDSIDRVVAEKVENIGIKRSAEDYLSRMKPIACSLDKVQRNTSTISDAVSHWRQLEQDMSNCPECPPNVMKSVKERMQQALTPAHYLAYLIHPIYRGKALTSEQIDFAMEYCSEEYSECMPTVVNFRAQTGPFKPYMLSDNILQKCTPLAWWHSQSSAVDSNTLLMCDQLLGAVCSSAGIERIFSTFGFVHSKVRNRLGTEKAAKLVFVYRLLNKFKCGM